MSAVGLGTIVKEREFRVQLIMLLRLLNPFVPHSNECRKLVVTNYVNTYAFRIKSRSKFNENMRNETHVRLFALYHCVWQMILNSIKQIEQLWISWNILNICLRCLERRPAYFKRPDDGDRVSRAVLTNGALKIEYCCKEFTCLRNARQSLDANERAVSRARKHAKYCVSASIKQSWSAIIENNSIKINWF